MRLSDAKSVSGVATQGRGDAGWWVTTYKVPPKPSLLFTTCTIFILYYSLYYALVSNICNRLY